MAAYDGQQNPGSFNYALQYDGEAPGYLVAMINETNTRISVEGRITRFPANSPLCP